MWAISPVIQMEKRAVMPSRRPQNIVTLIENPPGFCGSLVNPHGYIYENQCITQINKKELWH
jgi:hypothetical protein